MLLVKIKKLVRKPSIERRVHNWYHDTMKRAWRKIEGFSGKLSSIRWGKALQHVPKHFMTEDVRRNWKCTANEAGLKREQTK